jgi:hypothetical protein
MAPYTLTNLYRSTIESNLSGWNTAWYGNCTARNRRALQRVVRSGQLITGGKLPALQDTSSTRCHRKAKKIIKRQQPPEPLPLHPAIIQKVRSVQVHQSFGPTLLSQGHQTVKIAITSTFETAAYLHGLEMTGHFNEWNTSHFNNVYIFCITHPICIYCILLHFTVS